MVSTAPTSPNIITDTWVKATWEEFLAASEKTEANNTSCYYDTDRMRIEAMPIGFAHSKDNSTLATVITLYGTLKNIPFISLTNASFRKTGERESQPDLACYLGPDLPDIPRSNSPIDLNVHPAPTLVIEISASTLNDDLGQKRLLYERLGVQEYWVVDIESMTITAFEVKNGGSRQIQVSQVLDGLDMAIVEAALQRSQTEEDGAINRWLMQEFKD